MKPLPKTDRSCVLAAIFTIGLVAGPASADFVNTTWTVERFTGETWFVQPNKVIGQTQMFNGGYAEGVFYSCDFNGQSMTYTTYANDDFFDNPEFDTFIPLKANMEADSETLFVHRVTCNGSELVPPRVLYPLVTNETRQQAWYLYEGGVFSLGTQR
jgi:hypothetical protein